MNNFWVSCLVFSSYEEFWMKMRNEKFLVTLDGFEMGNFLHNSQLNVKKKAVCSKKTRRTKKVVNVFVFLCFYILKSIRNIKNIFFKE